MVHRDRQGQEVSLDRWADLWDDMKYRVVAEDEVEGVQVRTVWEGMDDVVGAMFATGISQDGGLKWQTRRDDARTEDEALIQHREVADEIRNSGKSSC
ncbi:hypothetical protein ACIOEX_20570 [Streptomyces sp. NPDC087850]|uniref:hypothetical protein n=1 Tax=Streptomyces sp. NPDC087850 TaxID=3365809 RepID=UPI0037F28EF0